MVSDTMACTALQNTRRYAARNSSMHGALRMPLITDSSDLCANVSPDGQVYRTFPGQSRRMGKNPQRSPGEHARLAPKSHATAGSGALGLCKFLWSVLTFCLFTVHS